MHRDQEAKGGIVPVTSSMEDMMGLGPGVDDRPYSPPPSDVRLPASHNNK